MAHPRIVAIWGDCAGALKVAQQAMGVVVRHQNIANAVPAIDTAGPMN